MALQEQVNKGVEAVTEFFQGNPFTTPVGQRIEHATDGSLASENWALNLEICDVINSAEDGPRDAIRAIRKRLQQCMGKNHTSVMYTLTVLETCVKNCGPPFHLAVSQKEFVQELVRLIGPKYDPPQVVQEKVLGLIQSWADAFRSSPSMQGIVEVYDELKSKGIDFPMTDLDSMAPIMTPARPTAAPGQQVVGGQAEGGGYAAFSNRGPVNPTGEQLAKLRSELDVVQGNLRVLREMLSELHPGQESPDDLALLTELHNTCQAMKLRLLDLLQMIANEEVTNELLLINDEMNNVFEKYDRYMRNRSQPSDQQQPSSSELIDLGADGAGATAAAAAKNTTPLAVVEREKVPSLDEKMKGLGLSSYADNRDVDQLEGGLSAATATKGEFVAGGAAPAEQNVGDKEQDLKEMESWLSSQPQPSSNDASNNGTSAAFDQFLAQRATAGQQTVPPGAAAEAKRDEQEQKLFDL